MRGMEDMEGMERGENKAHAPMPSDKDKPLTEEGQPEGTGQTIEIPIEFVGGKKFEAGDELVLKVVSIEDGKLEVEYATGKDEPQGPPSAEDEIDQMAAESGSNSNY